MTASPDKTGTPMPWPAPEYDNHGNGGFSEWWEIDGIARFYNEADANFAFRAVNAHDDLVKALDALINQPCPGSEGLMEIQELGRRALSRAKGAA